MTVPFQNVYSDELKIPASRIQALTETYRDRQRTGIIRLAYPQDKHVYLLFQKGKVINSYQMRQSSMEELENWPEAIARSGEAYARLIPLSPAGLQAYKLAIGGLPANSETMVAIQLRGSIADRWKNEHDPRLYLLSWNAAEGLIFYPGDSQVEHSIFFSTDRLVDQPGISPTFSLWADPVCKVDSYFLDPKSPVWQEFILRRTFSKICDRSFPRYEEITGRAMVDTIIRSIILLSSLQNIDISIASYRVVDRAVFSSPQAVADFYRVLLRTMFDNVEKVIGPRLNISLVKEIINDLRPEEQELAHRFDLLSPELLNKNGRKDEINIGSTSPENKQPK